MIRELTWAERAVWGTCPVCGAKEGEGCKRPVGTRFVDSPVYTHIARIDAAPKRVKMEGVVDG